MLNGIDCKWKYLIPSCIGTFLSSWNFVWGWSITTHPHLCWFFMACPYQFYIHHFFVTVNKKLEHRWQEKLILKILKLNLQISRGVVIRNCKKGLTTNHICLQSHFPIITSKITRGMYILTRCVNWKNNRKRIRYLVDK